LDTDDDAVRMLGYTAPRPPVTVAIPHIVRSLGSKESHIQSHNPLRAFPLSVEQQEGQTAHKNFRFKNLGMAVNVSEWGTAQSTLYEE